MIKKFIYLSIMLINSFVLGASESKVYFINLQDGEIVENPILIQFGLSGKGVAPAGVNIENTGHHHLLIDVKAIDFYMPIPSSKNHLHFGGGQTETSIELAPGEHELQLVLGDLYHVPLSPPITSNKIKIIVK
ncbi:MAG TPA: DUF4399 domain-containing protein [SAR86 cluster bacterium]|nr:DUF4399 domain-containing protein [SAR86 cluster bacterium]